MTAIRKYLSEKAQGLVEYVLILAFIAGVAMSLGGMSGTVKDVFDEAVLTIANLTKKSDAVPLAIDPIKDIQGNYIGSGGEGNVNSSRGFIRSQWLKDGDENIPEIADIMSEAGATAWVYINDKNLGNVQGPVGLYWTTESLTNDMFTMQNISGKTQTYSNEQMISYYYNPATKEYSVIKNYVWTNQGDLKNLGETTTVALTPLKKDYEKPAGEVIGTATSYLEAQKIYSKAVRENGGSFIYK